MAQAHLILGAGYSQELRLDRNHHIVRLSEIYRNISGTLSPT